MQWIQTLCTPIFLTHDYWSISHSFRSVSLVYKIFHFFLFKCHASIVFVYFCCNESEFTMLWFYRNAVIYSFRTNTFHFQATKNKNRIGIPLRIMIHGRCTIITAIFRIRIIRWTHGIIAWTFSQWLIFNFCVCVWMWMFSSFRRSCW